MHVVSSREFRANQGKYFALAEREPVFVKRRGAKPISISVVQEADMLTESDLASIQRGLEDMTAGRVYALGTDESLDNLLERL